MSNTKSVVYPPTILKVFHKPHLEFTTSTCRRGDAVHTQELYMCSVLKYIAALGMSPELMGDKLTKLQHFLKSTVPPHCVTRSHLGL